MSVLESTALLPKEGVFVLCAIALLAVLYFVLKAFKAKARPEEDKKDDEEIVAAITAAVAEILNEEAEREEREPNSFRVVAFKRTNNRRIGE